jgi:TldD protein
VLNAGGGGVLFHEACGHGLEADVIAKDTTVYARTRGQRVGSDLFSGVDDPTLVGEWGSFSFDDEGTPAERTVLFDHGDQLGEMSDRISAWKLGTVPSGNGRRQSYAHVPQPRMTNSIVLPGESDPKAIVADVEHGLYAEGLGGGEVNPATGDFVFGVTEAYLIEKGELTRRVRGANLIGNGPRALSLVDAVGTDFAMKQGMCGKGGQWVPVSFGTPTLRIARLTVGGTG